MTTLDHTAMQLPAASRPAFWARVTRGGASFIRIWRNRQAFGRLADLSDKELADIGLIRADLMTADNGHGDPTARLSMIVHQRLSAEDAARRVA
jgi:uncharacterized protein YjiS (DUF1127 family)